MYIYNYTYNYSIIQHVSEVDIYGRTYRLTVGLAGKQLLRIKVEE